VMKKLLEFAGQDRRRIALAHVDLNKPEDYIVVAENFIKLINELGPIERTPHVQKSFGDLRHGEQFPGPLGPGRHPAPSWEDVYPGNQRNAMAFDKDFLGILREEWMKARINNVLAAENRFFDLKS